MTIAPAEIDRHAALLRQDPLYLDRCQVDTPSHVVDLVWRHVRSRRGKIGNVVDFGAGDGRFAGNGQYGYYLGYEIDCDRSAGVRLPHNAKIVNRCAFSHMDADADVCLGNPPYVRNQDLPPGWRGMAATEIERRTGVRLSGLANAWQYFFMLSIASAKADGLIALVLPFEWVARPAAEPIRRFIESNGWGVDVIRLPDGVFPGVMTAASLTIVNKRSSGWAYHSLQANGSAHKLSTPTGVIGGVLPYARRGEATGAHAKRGLSPGTQRVLTLSEGERVHAGLHIRSDVVRCVTTLKPLPADLEALTETAFDAHYRSQGAKCWLIRTDRNPSSRLAAYLASIDPSLYQTATCLSREEWWRFAMPAAAPDLLLSQAFKGRRPKVVRNAIGAHAVGGVAGIYGSSPAEAAAFIARVRCQDLRDHVVAYSNEMHKLEINQVNSMLIDLRGSDG